MDMTLAIAAIGSMIGWAGIYTAIMCLVAVFVLRTSIKMLRAFIAALLGIVVPGVLVGAQAATPWGQAVLNAMQSDMRPWIQLAIGAFGFLAGFIANLLIIRRNDGGRITKLEAFWLQLSVLVGGIALRALLYITGVSPVFAWF